MVIELLSDSSSINFNLIEVSELPNRNESIFNFAFSFLLPNNESFFQLPENYRSYFFSSDLIRMTDFISEKKQMLTKSSKDTFIEFDRKAFVNMEYDFELHVESGEYYHKENEGELSLILFFNINVAYEQEGTCMIGVKSRVGFEELDLFLESINNLLETHSTRLG